MTDDLDPERFRGELEGLRASLKAAPRSIDPAEYGDVDVLNDQREALARIRAGSWASWIPSRLAWAGPDHFADYGEDVAAELKDWATAPAGRNLVLFGPTGVGKSHAAVAACRPQFDAGREVRFSPVVELLDELRPGGDPAALAAYMSMDVLILDDLGTEKPTDWTWERLYAVVNRRWLEELPTVATSNLPPAELEPMLGPKIWSRLVGSDAVVLRITGKDRRRRNAK